MTLGAPLAGAAEAPGRGWTWSMTAAHTTLPKGSRVPAPALGTLEQVLSGPATDAGGRTNLVGALRAAMGLCGYESLKDFQQAELVTTR